MLPNKENAVFALGTPDAQLAKYEIDLFVRWQAARGMAIAAHCLPSTRHYSGVIYPPLTKQSHRKMLIDTFVNAMYLYDDKILITFNYKEGTKTITFSDVQEAVNSAASGSDLDCLTAPKKHDGFDTKPSCFFYIG